MDDGAILQLFAPLYSDIKEEDEFYRKKPLLAHYTSLDALEKILTTNEIWFSNPLFMNDLEEVKFGILHGATVFKGSQVIREALKSELRHTKFTAALDHFISYFEREHLLDTYVFCLSEHTPENRDGLLSMWRGYGGNGRGAAIVFDTSKFDVVKGSPLIIAQVKYGSLEKRFSWFNRTAATFATILTQNHIPDEKIYLAANALFERVKAFALFTKHHGFKEENEWRVVYMSERDTGNKLRSMQHYLNGPRGVEPRLRFRVAPIEGLTAPDLSFNKIVAAILLGPSTSSPLAVRSVARMLEVIGKPELKNRLIASSIPFRPILAISNPDSTMRKQEGPLPTDDQRRSAGHRTRAGAGLGQGTLLDLAPRAGSH